MGKISKSIKKAKFNLLEFAYSFVNIKSTIIEEHNGVVETSNKICFFASYDPQGIVDEYVLNYIKAIQENNYDVYFCSTSLQKINETDLINLKKVCVKIFRKKNIGLDFCSWKLCYAKLDKSKKYEQILLTNDSILGPIFDLKPCFSAIENSKADLIGMTDNFEYSYHIQSYFFVFKENAIVGFLPDFMDKIKILFDKDEIVHKYEIGLTTDFIARKFKIEVLFPYESIIQKMLESERNHLNSLRVNSTTILWDTLIVTFKFPFLKRELLTKNTVLLKSLDNWVQIVSKYNPEFSSIIISYLKRMKIDLIK